MKPVLLTALAGLCGGAAAAWATLIDRLRERQGLGRCIVRNSQAVARPENPFVFFEPCFASSDFTSDEVHAVEDCVADHPEALDRPDDPFAALRPCFDTEEGGGGAPAVQGGPPAGSLWRALLRRSFLRIPFRRSFLHRILRRPFLVRVHRKTPSRKLLLMARKVAPLRGCLSMVLPKALRRAFLLGTLRKALGKEPLRITGILRTRAVFRVLVFLDAPRRALKRMRPGRPAGKHGR